MATDYERNVFINCPFDADYLPLLHAMTFTISACRFKVRFALLEIDSATNRLERLVRLVTECRLGIHDISRTELNSEELPRFNMPFELGLFLGYLHGGETTHKTKRALIMDSERYRYPKFLSDIAGHDIMHHDNDPDKVITCVRDFLNTQNPLESPPGGKALIQHYQNFRVALPQLAGTLSLTEDETLSANNFRDYTILLEMWLARTNALVGLTSV